MTPFTFKCERSKHIMVASVPLPCFWFDSLDKDGSTFLLEKYCIMNGRAVAPRMVTFRDGETWPGFRKDNILVDIHIVCIAGSTTWGARVKVEIISIEMYIKWVWYIERVYPGSIPHSLGLKMNRSIDKTAHFDFLEYYLRTTGHH